MPGHDELIEGILASGEPRLVPPQRRPSPGRSNANPTDTLLILFPWQVDRAPAGLIELFQRPGGGPSAEQGYVEFLDSSPSSWPSSTATASCGSSSRLARDWSRFEQFVRRVHAGLDLRRTAYTIVNEGRLLLECDRVSLVVRRGRRYRLTAVSGVDTPNRRAELTRRMEKAVPGGGQGRRTSFGGRRRRANFRRRWRRCSASTWTSPTRARSGSCRSCRAKSAAQRPAAVSCRREVFGTFNKSRADVGCRSERTRPERDRELLGT